MPIGPRTILVVDDDEDVLFLATTFLSGRGYTIIQATNGAEGLSILASPARIDLLLTDIVMPGGIDGFDLAHQARQLRPDLRVLYTSGFSAEASRSKKAVSYGPLLPKPWRLGDLGSEVERALA